ncbi:MAG: hypothetical protein HFK10_07245 [Clostridia bacterium]|nr:hypothetical protein [Clostridia bacterium]
MKVHASSDTSYVRPGGSIMYGGVQSRRRPADCCPSATRLYFQNIL